MSNARPEYELPNKMASLELDSAKTNISSTSENCLSNTTEVPIRRSLRKKQPSTDTAIKTNRRVIMKPKKLQKSTLSEDDVKNLYSNSKVRNVSQKLETIFEEPKTVNNTLLFIGGTKIKRSLKFQETSISTKEKIKKRRSKIKRLLGNKNFTNRKKIPLNSFLKIIQNLEADDSAEECTND